ncbi:MAG: glycosyltransferase, partial [Myxococcaceae bacterium]|nr:glycosyltransferase [Myxococcaceae bacterium]
MIFAGPMTDAFLSLSFVVPVYRGEKHLAELVARQEAFRAQLESSGASVRLIEVIFVCDEPADGSAALLGSLARERPWISIIHLAKNSGQHAATAAGMLHTSGDWVVTMDEDGQHDPFRVPALFEATLPRSFDICYAASSSAVHSRWWRNASSRLAKRLTAWVVADPFVPMFNSFRLIRGEIARAAGALAGHDLYLDVALRWLTDRTCTAQIEMKDPRVDSGYRLGSLLSHFRKLVMTYHPPFFRWIPVAGFLFALGFGLLGAAVALEKL